ncbi:MAG: hypothetical protein PUD20_00335 [bacterium]|nr:hypothetical protein [bacterium]
MVHTEKQEIQSQQERIDSTIEHENQLFEDMFESVGHMISNIEYIEGKSIHG